jgi:hypothetical protein
MRRRQLITLAIGIAVGAPVMIVTRSVPLSAIALFGAAALADGLAAYTDRHLRPAQELTMWLARQAAPQYQTLRGMLDDESGLTDGGKKAHGAELLAYLEAARASAFRSIARMEEPSFAAWRSAAESLPSGELRDYEMGWIAVATSLYLRQVGLDWVEPLNRAALRMSNLALSRRNRLWLVIMRYQNAVTWLVVGLLITLWALL